ncbi:conserved hypothetical protein [Verticillium alfalfae VaMs.102]|uniref:Uncharacterized protein n=1 Tax=Verticillium alfalfae (strain VaMs.102 / ATCC MYA-4576 / FGSC 10136) TaxID=526221 RepID=C9SUV8_VERA1|nr:conserved hypothetical protein [Verticillium alfalfae VaMs.102]EEY22573.1 conserved hypothetical protein [Verticillium alfalfae VaMs.102]
MSDGRHSSAGHSVHSVHSLASGRASSLGMHTDNFLVSSHEDDSPIDAVDPPPEFFILGSVPSIIRCWLSKNFAHATMRYADLCTGSQKSVIDYSLIRELELEDELERDVDGVYKGGEECLPRGGHAREDAPLREPRPDPQHHGRF